MFVESFKWVPRVAINLVIKNKKGEILLTKRAIPPCVGCWHIPGSFLAKGEKLTDCINRVGSKELGLNVDSTNAELLGVFEDIGDDPRGHIVDIIYGYKVDEINLTPTEQSEEIKFFSSLPNKIGFNHKNYLLNISKHWIS